MSAEQIDLSIVVPCYRSGDWLERLAEQVSAALEPSGLRFELLLVNDASGDDTWDVIEQITSRYAFARGLDLLFNTGQYRTTMCGLQHARGELVVTMDDDLQQSPADILALVKLLQQDPSLDCVVAAMRGRGRGILRRLGSSLMGGLFRATYGKPRGLKMSSFRALRRRLVEALCQFDTVKPNINPLILQSTSRIENVDVNHHPRAGGRSGYNLLRLGRLMFDNVLSVSTLPLKIVSTMGLLAALGSVVLGVYYFVRALQGQFNESDEKGFATIVLLILFFGGMTLLSIGLLGEYIIRIMDEVRGRPWFVVRQQTGGGDDLDPGEES
jgi:glycosyltransferase involved in cell wall biosynthesis